MDHLFKTSFLSPPESVGLPIYWAAIGEERRDSPSYRWDGLKRGSGNHLLFQLTLAGEGRIRIGTSAPQSLGPGTGFLARLPSDHCYYYEKGNPAWHFIWAMWSGPALGAIWESISKTFVRPVVMSPASPEVRLLRATIRSQTDGGNNSPLDSVDAYRFLLTVCEGGSHQLVAGKRPVISTRIDRVYRGRPGVTIGKDGLARQLNLSRFQLYRASKKEFGISPKEWIARQKVHRACNLLKRRTLSVSAVAREVGIPDANYFARFFRNRTGHTPRDWRRLFAVNSEMK
jgi:AraC family transcriptional regulator